jgi:archaellum component FlaF (FlaF/FlaG flagellin family)
MKIYIASYYIIAAILFAGCHAESKGHNHAEDAHHEHEHEHEHEQDEIIFTHEQAEAAGLEVETVSPGAFRPVIKAGGQIEEAQGDEVTVAATSNGIISFAGTSLAEGTYVRAGEALLSVSAKHLLEGDPVSKAEITYERARKEYLRTE